MACDAQKATLVRILEESPKAYQKWIRSSNLQVQLVDSKPELK